MAASQFTIYTSSDASAPVLTGQAGKLGDMLKACLVDGYGAKAAAGWSCPVAESGDIFSFKNGTGSTEMGFVLNDNGPNATASYKEAWVTGWESVAGVGASVGSGSGQFPLPSQCLTTGHVVWRKSTAADATARPWIVVADAHTCYIFLATGDYAQGTGLGYFPAMFGDIYASRTDAADDYRCLLIGRTYENVNGGPGLSNAINNCVEGFAACYTYFANGGTWLASSPGNFMPRPAGGVGSSLNICKQGDIGSMVWLQTSTNNYCPMSAGSRSMNAADNSFDLAPWVVLEGAGGSRRGRLRGLWQVCSGWTNFTTGQTINGAGLYAGRTFMIITDILSYSTVAIETSNTVETN